MPSHADKETAKTSSCGVFLFFLNNKAGEYGESLEKNSPKLLIHYTLNFSVYK